MGGQAFYDRSDPTDPQNAWPTLFSRIAVDGGEMMIDTRLYPSIAVEEYFISPRQLSTAIGFT
jgi:hypothetical protein